MQDVFTNSAPKNIRQLFIHSSMHISSAKKFHIQDSRLGVKHKSFSALDARLWNCLPPDWCKLTKRVFKRKLHKSLFTVVGIEDDYVNACSLISKVNSNNYHTL